MRLVNYPSPLQPQKVLPSKDFISLFLLKDLSSGPMPKRCNLNKVSSVAPAIAQLRNRSPRMEEPFFSIASSITPFLGLGPVFLEVQSDDRFGID
ncbi:hypothetical protein NG799_26390 [Laspinema sp. D1]|uniref:Uncharacterized protein n=1 Tax=Laspinema palackyanum D2a TaxID=2953684 RepID=A0ABT2MYL2_9CYAN|nr:hypothetical protein [Laspinema sp. D2a]